MLACLLWAGPAQADWKVAETANFRVYSEAPDSRLMEQAAVLEDFRSLLIRMTGHVPAADMPRLDVFMVDDLATAMPWREPPRGMVGFYRASAGRISAVAQDRASGRVSGINAQQILLHEFAHHFMLAANGLAHPAWYVEGFAEYFSTAEFQPDRIELGKISPNRAIWLSNLPWIPLEQLLAGRPGAASGRSAAMFYAQSWALTHYMFRAPGMREKLIAYLLAFSSGMDPVEAFRLHVDPDLGAFQSKLRRYVNAKATYTRFDRPPATPVAVRLTALPPSAGTMLMRLVALEHGVSPGEGAAALADVRALAAGAPLDPLAKRALALAELEHGDPVTAIMLLDQLLASTPGDADLLRWRALSVRPMAGAASPAVVAKAKRFLARALQSDPDDWRTLHAYVRLHGPTSRPLPPELLTLLLRAHELAPQVSEVVLDAAVALQHAGLMPEAAAVLQPLAASPHGGAAAELAARLLDRARAGDRAGFLGEVAAVRQRRVTELALIGAVDVQLR
ncbi:MAG: hypothetical protein KGZ61_11440 [Sandarakinorhabdus sp.]|nr:hypothetical protein [Sandarakinorhabdus sp.]